MTVSTTTNKVSYSGTGSQTVFAYTFKIFADGDLDVYIRDTNGTETLQTITTNYTVSGAGSDSGGNVTFVTAPGSTDTVVIQRKLGLTQGTDYVANDPFPAESHEDALDRLTFITQQIQEEVDRSIKASVTNTISTTEFAVSAADRANKFFAFDSAGDLVVSQEIGTFRGNWAGSTSYAQRDIVKDTSTNNIFIVNTAHTSSGAQPLTSNANSAKYDLLVDAATATAQATTATAQAAASAASAAASATSATSSAASASTSTTQASNSSTSASNASTSETNAATSATASAASAAAAAATFDLFDDAYLGAKSSNPSVDNDGNALQDGALFFDTVNSVMKVFDLSSTTWFQLTPTVSNQTNINTVAGISSDVTAVAGDAADIGTLATDINGSNNIGTVSGAITNVNLVGGSIANVNTVATNMADVNSFANTYFIGTSAPSSPTTGDLWFDSTPSVLTMKVYNGSGFVNAGSSVNGTAARESYIVGTNSGSYTGSTTVFPATYDAGFVDVYLNGVKLHGADFTATNGTSITLASAATSGDTLDVLSFGTFTLANIAANQLTDVYTTGVADGQILQYSGTNSRFEPVTFQGGAGYFVGENGTTGNTSTGLGDIFRVHEAALDTATTIPSNTNALAAGPLTLNAALTVNGTVTVV